ncbi:acyltransferase family protein [Oceanobacillus sp. CF4.6]|uniref:acyltransferase family protein n=1 Tax=Oceanobacillus sp. CF4.6 TaxID=3373080 RepID=UPI003EE4F982
MRDLRIPEKKFRPEIEGIRVVAAFLVAIYHIWVGSVSGGVDVFFIVSGYLITISLLNRIERDGKINYIDNLLGLGRRLLPMAMTVLLTTIALSFVIMPTVQWKQIISEVFSSAFYYQNWQLATNSIDYLGQNNNASPLQHFWALSIQGQFYITWPFLITFGFILARKVLKTPIRKTLLSILIVIFLASLSYSIYITAVNQPWAYFDTFARVWEFSLGGMLALLLPYIQINRNLSLILGWIGLAIICFTGVLLPVSTVFPGYVALLPTTGVMLVIIAGENGNKFGVDKFLGSKPFLKLGGISYGFYLWHWPLLIFYYSYFNTDSVTLFGGLAIIILTLILSYALTKILESPIRGLSVKHSKKKLIPILAAFVLSTVLANGAWAAYTNNEAQTSVLGKVIKEDYPGALAIHEDIQPNPDVEPLLEDPTAKESLPEFYSDGSCYSTMRESEVTMCSYGDTEDPDYTLALVGGSHSGHWFPALKELSNDLNIQIDVYNKDACRFSANDMNETLSETCITWNKNVVDPLLEAKPDIIFTTANVAEATTIPQGYIDQWGKFEGVSEILAMRDTPRMPEDIPLCLEQNDDETCSVEREEVLSGEIPWENTDGLPENVTFADLSNYFCDDETCYPVIGNMVVYRDKHHITNLYSETLSEPLKDELLRAIEKVNN